MRAHRATRLLKTKIKNVHSLKKILLKHKRAGKNIVFTNGCFDLLHYGHIKYLERAKTLGDILVVALNSDESVKRIKGEKRPIIGEGDRIKTIAALESVDYCLLFDEDTPIKLIETLRPDILVKGSDWKNEAIVGSSTVTSTGGSVHRINVARGRSTSDLIKKIVKLNHKGN